MSYEGVNGLVSTNNSTTTALGSGATYTGTGEQNQYPHVLVYCISDTAGTLYFQWSNDGATYYDFPTAGYPVTANVPEFQVAVKGGRYFRVKFVNSASAQSSFNLTTYYGNNFVPSVSPLDQAVALDAPAILTRPTFPWLDISRGLTTGMSVIKKFGRNTAVSTSAFVPITLGGIYNTPQSGSATTLRIKAGGNTNDTAGGTGAREVTLIGLDENWNEVTEAVATNGASASTATTATFTRLYRAFVSKSGTYATSAAGSHSAAITIENGGGGTNWATIGATNFPKSQSEIGAYSVPTGYTAYVFLDDVTVDSGKTVDLIFFWRAGADDTTVPYSAMRSQSVLAGITGGVTSLAGRSVPFGPYVGPCDIGFMGLADTNAAAVSVEFEIFLINET